MMFCDFIVRMAVYTEEEVVSTLKSLREDVMSLFHSFGTGSFKTSPKACL